MSLGFSFTGKIQLVEDLIDQAKALAGKFGYRLGIGENGLRFDLCPGGGELYVSWEAEDSFAGRWILKHISQKDKTFEWTVKGGCQTTPIGPGLHKAAIELLDMLPIKGLVVDDEAEYYENRDFERLQRTHFYGWLDQLVAMSSQHRDSSLFIAWDMGRYHPREIDGTVVTYMGRFSIPDMISMVDQQGIEALADRFFIWDSPGKDARFYRNCALNALWENCYFTPSSRSEEDEAINNAIIKYLEQAAELDPQLPLPRAAYREICTLAEQTPVIPNGPELESPFPIGYRKELVTHNMWELKLTIPGSYQFEWEENENGGTNRFCDSSIESPIWRVNRYESNGEITDFLPFLNELDDLTEYEIPNGRAKWGWKQLEGKDEPVYQIQCQVITGSVTFLITITYFRPEEKEDIAVLLGKLSAQTPQVNYHQATYDVADE